MFIYTYMLCVCIYVCIYIYYTYSYIYVYVYLFMLIDIILYIITCVYIYICIYIYICVFSLSLMRRPFLYLSSAYRDTSWLSRRRNGESQGSLEVLLWCLCVFCFSRNCYISGLRRVSGRPWGPSGVRGGSGRVWRSWSGSWNPSCSVF